MKINDKLFCQYRFQLELFANNLSVNTTHPLDLLSICKSLNIEILKDTDFIDKAVLVVKGGYAGIKLSEKYYNNLNSPFIRHIIAHEIGHYLLHFKMKVSISKNEYWVFEELCDFFSRSLLIPRNKIEPLLSKINNNLIQIYNFTNYIAKRFNVTWISSVSRLHDIEQSLLFLNFKYKRSSNRFVVNKSLLIKNKYLNSQLNLQTKYIYNLLKNNQKMVLLNHTDKEFSILHQKFPIIFCHENKEALIIFRHNSLSIMAINYAQQGN